MPRYEPVPIRFWKKVRKTRKCWLWTAARNACGYGLLGRRGESCLAHRVSWELHFGRVPAGLCVLHRCDVPHCVRPSHLWLGKQADNIHDMLRKGRQNYSHMYGKRNPRGKLSDAQVSAIRRAYPQVRGQRGAVGPIAEKYGVTRAMVWQIGTGRAREASP